MRSAKLSPLLSVINGHISALARDHICALAEASDLSVRLKPRYH